MNFVLFDGLGVWAPLHGLVSWLAPSAPSRRHKATHSDNPVLDSKLHHYVNPICLPLTEVNQTLRTSAQRPLKIVRFLEADHAPANVGRMVISGRMSDVCAELDRLAAKESALH
jgi:hypothetical protein